MRRTDRKRRRETLAERVARLEKTLGKIVAESQDELVIVCRKLPGFLDVGSVQNPLRFSKK